MEQFIIMLNVQFLVYQTQLIAQEAQFITYQGAVVMMPNVQGF